MPDPKQARPLERIQALPSWLAGRVAARGRGLVAQELSAEQLKPAHLAVLAAVAQYGPLAQADLVRRLEIDAKDVVLLLNRMEQDGYVSRAPDPKDRRKNAVSVTATGTKTLRRCLDLAERANAELLAPLSAAERAQFMALLAKVNAAQGL